MTATEEDTAKTSFLTPHGDPHIQLFLTMHYRKMLRNLYGPQKRQSRYHLIALLGVLIVIYGFSAYKNAGRRYIQITLSFDEIAAISIWIAVAIIITAIFGSSKFVLLLYWMFVYWPLLFIIIAVLFGDGDDNFHDTVWILFFLPVMEVLTLLGWVLTYYVHPKLVTSNCFRQTFARVFWRIKLLDDGMAMEYDGWLGRCGKRYSCRYVGSTNEAGLPHGRGIWFDDSYNGEVLSGSWENGNPVAPFSSRQYGGKGSTYSAVQIAYFMATDDPFDSNKFIPTNDEPARCGIASVECSTGGVFMSHLPEAALLSGPDVEGKDGVTIGKCCKDLDTGSKSVDPITSLQISSGDPRGVQISGHLHAATGLPFTRRIRQIVIDVVGTTRDNDFYEPIEDLDEEAKAEMYGHIRLEVNNDWVRIKTKDALIFIAGFKSCQKNSLESFGQLLAMSPKLNQQVYPILYAWPGAQVLTYRNASIMAASDNNRKYFLQMLKSLQAEGITNIHIVTHSLGVQTLMNCFQNNSDGSPSSVSQCFEPAPSGADSTPSLRDVGKLVCRSMTLLNPDFPLPAFKEHAFRSIRRVSSLITIVGDKSDQALFWSSFINGSANRFGFSQPSVLDFEGRADQRGLLPVLGRAIDSLCIQGDRDEGIAHNIVEFQQKSLLRQSVRIGSTEETSKIYLDCDVIDTTGLDTNVNNLRHSAYNVNNILLRDIEEIVTTGRRAAERSTLLHKKGNVFEYCHAPSFVMF